MELRTLGRGDCAAPIDVDFLVSRVTEAMSSRTMMPWSFQEKSPKGCRLSMRWYQRDVLIARNVSSQSLQLQDPTYAMGNTALM